MQFIVQAFSLGAFLLFCGGSGSAFAQTYPNKPVRMVVPFPPGGAADIIGRTVAQKLSVRLDQQVIVDNRGGARGNIGAELAAKAPGDGYTILLGALTSHAINYTLEREILRYDLKKDFAPITIAASVPPVFVPSGSLVRLSGQSARMPVSSISRFIFADSLAM